jgi:hypothetical protein
VYQANAMQKVIIAQLPIWVLKHQQQFKQIFHMLCHQTFMFWLSTKQISPVCAINFDLQEYGLVGSASSFSKFNTSIANKNNFSIKHKLIWVLRSAYGK